MKKRAMLLMASLMCIALMLAGCAGGRAPTTPPAEEVLTADDAFREAVAWLQSKYPDSAPSDGITWVFETVPVLGPGGQPLLGAAERHATAADWSAVITWAVVSPEFLQYQVSLVSPTLGWFWEGSVRARDGQVHEDSGLQLMTAQLAEERAWHFVRSSPTFMTSGMNETLDLIGFIETGKPFSWAFAFGFDSRHSGYGDTTGQVVLQVITPHVAVVTVEAMVVTEAVMDGRWDMLAQEFISMNAEEAREMAEEFVRDSPTFVFDGMPETLQLVSIEPLEVAGAWSMVFRFDSAHAGYGDRTGQMLAQVITPHEVVLVVRDARVYRAVMDGRWDMMAQQFITIGEEEARQIAREFVIDSPTFAFDGILATLELAETLHPDIENAWTFVFRFESAHAGYGDRTGQMLAEVITPHEAHVTVENGEVVSALMDEKWDMLSQRLVE